MIPNANVAAPEPPDTAETIASAKRMVAPTNEKPIPVNDECSTVALRSLHLAADEPSWVTSTMTNRG
jgi:hypothetical protein